MESKTSLEVIFNSFPYDRSEYSKYFWTTGELKTSKLLTTETMVHIETKVQTDSGAVQSVKFLETGELKTSKSHYETVYFVVYQNRWEEPIDFYPRKFLNYSTNVDSASTIISR